MVQHIGDGKKQQLRRSSKQKKFLLAIFPEVKENKNQNTHLGKKKPLMGCGSSYCRLSGFYQQLANINANFCQYVFSNNPSSGSQYLNLINQYESNVPTNLVAAYDQFLGPEKVANIVAGYQAYQKVMDAYIQALRANQVSMAQSLVSTSTSAARSYAQVILNNCPGLVSSVANAAMLQYHARTLALIDALFINSGSAASQFLNKLQTDSQTLAKATLPPGHNS